jgi:hypothetical protein
MRINVQAMTMVKRLVDFHHYLQLHSGFAGSSRVIFRYSFNSNNTAFALVLCRFLNWKILNQRENSTKTPHLRLTLGFGIEQRIDGQC